MKQLRIISVIVVLLALSWVNHQPAMASSVNVDPMSRCHDSADNSSMPKPATVKMCCVTSTDVAEVAPVLVNIPWQITAVLPEALTLTATSASVLHSRVNVNPPNNTLFNLFTIIKRE
ncbi:MAG: hypothetical protein WCW27_04215 [Patescibacteria group bacterium]|jgi:hypothetical protein